MTLGENIRIKRKEKGLTQEDLAEKIGVHSNTIRQWEKNKNSPKAQDIEKIARALDTTVSYLSGEISFATNFERTIFTEGINETIVSKLIISELPENFFSFWGGVLDEVKKAVKRNDFDEMELIINDYLKPAYKMIIDAQKQKEQVHFEKRSLAQHFDIHQNNIGHDATVNFGKI